MRNIIIFLLKTIIAFLLLWFLYYFGKLDFSVVFSDAFSLSFYLSLFIYLGFFIFFKAYRWYILLRFQNINISFLRSLKYYMIGQFFTSFVPGAIGADISRSYYMMKNMPTKKVASISTIVADRLFGIYGLFLLSSLSFIFFVVESRFVVNNLIFSLGMISVIVSVSVPAMYCFSQYCNIFTQKYMPFSNKISRLVQKYDINLYSVKQLMQCGILSIVSSMFFIGAFYTVAKQLEGEASFLHTAIPIVFIGIANMIPVTPGGIGVGEFTSSYLFNSFGVFSGAEIMLLLRIWLFVFRLPGGVLFIIERKN